MADANNTGNKWWRIAKSAIISFLEDVGILAAVHEALPSLYKTLGGMLGNHLKKKVENDKRAEMLRELRKMNDAGINITKLLNRHQKSIDNLQEYRFVELLSKIPAPDPADPSTTRAPITPGAPGFPQNDRQADLKWLNDMSEKRFNQMLDWLDHDVVLQWYQIGRDRITKILKKIRDDLKQLGPGLRSQFGVLGGIIVTAAGATWYFLVRSFRWIFSSGLRIAFMAVIVSPILFLVAALIAPVRHQRQIQSLFGVTFLLLTLGLVGVAYLFLAPSSIGGTLFAIVVMSMAMLWCLWKFAWIRRSFFIIAVGFVLIMFLRNKDVVFNKAQAALTRAAQENAQNRELEALRKEERDSQKFAVQRVSNDGTQGIEKPLFPARPNPPAPTPEAQVPTTTAPLTNEAMSTVTPSENNQEALSTPTKWYKPLSGDEGGYIVRMSAARYVAAGKIGFDLYVQPTEGLDTEKLYLNEGEVQDEEGGGQVSMTGAGLGRNYIRCKKGNTYPCLLMPAMPTYLEVEIDQPSGVRQLGFSFQFSLGGAWLPPYTFIQIPVYVN